jgi:DNA-binding FadR family transcriptional regulator
MSKLSSEFLDYLAAYQHNYKQSEDHGGGRINLPSLSEISKALEVSIPILREQLEVAKALGFVEVRPRTGIRCLPYSFEPAVRESLAYAVTKDWDYFIAYSDLRNHIEEIYWDEAIRKLTPTDHDQLQSLVDQAWIKLKGQPIHIPYQEHRHLHLLIYQKLGNPFVQGLLEAFWDAYESIGLNLYSDIDYLQQIWSYHQQMVAAIKNGKVQEGFQALVKHRDLLFHRPTLNKGRINKPSPVE